MTRSTVPLTLTFLILFWASALAQPALVFDRTYDLGGHETVVAAVAAGDGVATLAVQRTNVYLEDSERDTLTLLRMDSAGDILWQRNVFIGDPGVEVRVHSFITHPDGGWVISFVGNTLVYSMLRLNDQGDELWYKSHTPVRQVVMDGNGRIMGLHGWGIPDDEFELTWFDDDGSELETATVPWQETYGSADVDWLVSSPDGSGGMVVAGNVYVDVDMAFPVFWRIAGDGTLLHQEWVETSDADRITVPRTLFTLTNGDLVCLALDIELGMYDDEYHTRVLRMAADGSGPVFDRRWDNYAGWTADGLELADGSLLLAGGGGFGDLLGHDLIQIDGSSGETLASLDLGMDEDVNALVSAGDNLVFGLGSFAPGLNSEPHDLYLAAIDPLGTAVEDHVHPTLPTTATLSPAYPNPFNASTRFTLTLPAPGHVTVTAHDLLGRPVATVLDDTRPAGSHAVALSATELASGTYFIRARVDDRALDTRKVVLLR